MAGGGMIDAGAEAVAVDLAVAGWPVSHKPDAAPAAPLSWWAAGEGERSPGDQPR
jgi:hypothetical protein